MESSLEDLLMARDTLIFILRHLGFLINIKKSYLEPTSTLEFLRVVVDSGEMTLSLPKENSSKYRIIARNPRKWESNSQGTKQTDWDVIIHSNSSPSDTLHYRHLQHQQIQKLICHNSFEEKVEIPVEARKELLWWKEDLNSLQREIFNFSPTANNNKLRCIITRLGSELSRTDNRGAMIHGGTKVSHKCLGAQGSQISYNVLHIKGKGCNISSHPHGQYGSPVILNENEGYQNQELTAISKEI